MQVVAQIAAEVGEQLHRVAHPRLAPRLGRVRDPGHPGGDDRLRVRMLDAAVRGLRLVELGAQVQEPAIAHAHAVVGGDGVHVLGRILGVEAVLHLHAPAVVMVLQHEVDHPGDGVRAVLRRRAVAQHFHALDGDGGNGGDVRPLGAIRRAIGDPLDDGAPVAALVVDQHEGVVGRQTAQVHGPQQRGGVPGRVRAHMERGHKRSEQIGHVRPALCLDGIGADGIDRHHGV